MEHLQADPNGLGERGYAAYTDTEELHNQDKCGRCREMAGKQNIYKNTKHRRGVKMSEATQVGEEIVLSQSYEVQKITYPVTEEFLKKVEADFSEIPSDLTIKENYTFIKVGVKSVGKLITETEAHRKFLKKASLDYGKKVDLAAKEIKERLQAVHAPMKEAKADFDTKAEIEKREAEQKEIERKDIIGEKISGIQSLLSENITSSSVALTKIIQTLNRDEVSTWADEFTEAAESAKTETLEKLRELLMMKSQAELAEKLEQEREQKELEAQKAARVEAARLAEENKRQAIALKAAQEKLTADQAKVEALAKKVEADRLEAEQKEKKEKKEKEEKEEKERVDKILAEQKRIDEETQRKIKKEEEEEQAKKEKLAREEALLAEKEKEKIEREEREKAEQLAAETLQEDIRVTAHKMMPYCNSKKKANLLINEIRENNFKNIKWI